MSDWIQVTTSRRSSKDDKRPRDVEWSDIICSKKTVTYRSLHIPIQPVTMDFYWECIPIANLPSKYIYVIKLSSGKYYVGKTSEYRLGRRIAEHSGELLILESKKSRWVDLYGFQDVECIFDGMTDFDEDVVTRMFMYIHGIENVRGGSYSSIELNKEEKLVLNKMFEQEISTPFTIPNLLYKQHHTLYCLRLETEKFFIVLINQDTTLSSFLESSERPDWLKTYKILGIVAERPDSHHLLADKYVTISLCKLSTGKRLSPVDIVKYGLKFIRGGSFDSNEINESQFNVLVSMVTTAKDLCYHCHSAGHLKSRCPFLMK